jgi:toxin FitB
MIVVDTNVASAMMRPTLNPTVIARLGAQPVAELWSTSVTLHELFFGIERLPISQ